MTLARKSASIYFCVKISSLSVLSLLDCQCFVFSVDVDRLRRTNYSVVYSESALEWPEYVYQYACLSLSLYC